ncbi:MAG: hypothetical protein ACRDF4_03165, partial [Rhabdochlamydiaceae bacterium]
SPTGVMPIVQTDEVQSLRGQLKELQKVRADVLDDIECRHDTMIRRIHTIVSEFERDLRETDFRYVVEMTDIDNLRNKNRPLRIEIWNLEAKIKELTDGKG